MSKLTRHNVYINAAAKLRAILVKYTVGIQLRTRNKYGSIFKPALDNINVFP